MYKSLFNTKLSTIKALIAFAFIIVIGLFSVENTYALNVDKNEEDYNTWMQTIYSRDNGLSPGEANDIATTSDGIIWIGTYAGLYRYNGTEFKIQLDDLIKNVNCLYVDDHNRLWVGTNDNGLFVIKNGEIKDVLNVKKGLPANSVKSIVMSSDGKYYVGTSGGMAVITYKNKARISDSLSKVTYADEVTADKDGSVVAVSSYGEMYLIKKGKILDNISLTTNERFTACKFDSKGKLRVGSSDGIIYTYDIQGGKFKKTKSVDCKCIEKINNIIFINDNTMVVCADNGICYFDSNNNIHRLNTPNFTSSVYSAMVDYQGNVWFVSARMGLLRLSKTNFTSIFGECSISPRVVNSIARYEGYLYVGTDEGLVVIDDKRYKSIDNDVKKALEGVRIRQIYRDSSNVLWLCTYGKGLIEYNGKNIKYYSEENNEIGTRVREIIQLKSGELVVSSEKGLIYIKNGKIYRTLTAEDGLKNQVILCMLEQPDGTLLACSDGDGIYEIKDKSIGHIGIDKGLSSGVVLKIVKDKKADGYFVVTSNGICYINSDSEVKLINNFPYSNNFDIIQHGDDIIVTGSAGIHVTSREELMSNKNDMSCALLNDKTGLMDGLVANSWYLKEANKLYLATNSGVTLYDMNEHLIEQENYKIGISSVVVDGEEQLIKLNKPFTFTKDVKRLEIQPEVVNYTLAEPAISCYLEGFDKKPIVMSQRDISPVVYTNLPAGKYKFHINLINLKSGEKISEKVYDFNRKISFTDTTWYYVLIITVLILVTSWIIFLAYKRLYTIRIRNKESELKRAWKLSITDELTGLKNRLALREEFSNFIGKSLAVSMLDIDYFKSINDDFGHHTGDDILRRVGEIISESYSEPSAAYRFGGDEFIIFHVTDSEEEASKLLDDISKKTKQITVEGIDFEVNISYGTVLGNPKNESDLRKMKEIADNKLYDRKNER